MVDWTAPTTLAKKFLSRFFYPRKQSRASRKRVKMIYCFREDASSRYSRLNSDGTTVVGDVQRGSTRCPLWNDLDGYWHDDVVALSRPLKSRARMIPLSRAPDLF